MARLARVLAFLICCAPCAALAEDGAGGSNAPAGDELRILRQMIEQQSKQLDVLAQEIARLNLLLEGKTPTGAGLAPSPAAEAAGVEASAPSESEPAAAKAVAVENAEAVDHSPNLPANPSGGPVHIVTKGETLTAIAKHYKITVPELLKVNKIADVRKLQIGQTLNLPPGAKLQESPAPTPTTPQQ